MIVKITAKFVLPGSTLFGKEICQSDPKQYTESNFIVLESKIKKGKKTEIKRERFQYFTRKSIPATQVINISLEAYKYWVSNEIPEFSNKKVWNKLSKTQKIEAHLIEMAAGLNGELESYYVYPD